ncbi:E3 ubiquitin-protein ligase BIG BROTHER-like [Phoenix dactylifera]|uniref:E3 ubiquitin-protein ligase BIG BROTHER-like n=1 Tax=Phoenix dactylifera TaxID=42345 RepID=A0A8B7CJW7_PHODC|nr:E3 ubiquitin-protein ligase BIG BROTHER-like [Phoenix dactylifera]
MDSQLVMEPMSRNPQERKSKIFNGLRPKDLSISPPVGRFPKGFEAGVTLVDADWRPIPWTIWTAAEDRGAQVGTCLDARHPPPLNISKIPTHRFETDKKKKKEKYPKAFIMAVEFETKGKQQGGVHYVNAGVPRVVEGNFDELHPEFGNLTLVEVLQDQESVYQSLQRNDAQSDLPKASSSNSKQNHDHGQSGGAGSSSETINVDSQLAADEALARQLQEFENLHVDTSFSEFTGTEAGITPAESSVVNSEPNSTNVPDEETRQDNVDPDNMTYEELQSLGEAIGSEGRGLSDELISYLPSSRYKTGFFSRKGKHEECVICQSTYKNRDKLITLPCKHYYHSKCISHWLKINKACPVCNEEVFG